MFRVILDERKKREADPTLAMLRESVADAKKSGASDPHTRDRLNDMLQFFELMTSWYEQTRRLSPVDGEADPDTVTLRLIQAIDIHIPARGALPC